MVRLARSAHALALVAGTLMTAAVPACATTVGLPQLVLTANRLGAVGISPASTPIQVARGFGKFATASSFGAGACAQSFPALKLRLRYWSVGTARPKPRQCRLLMGVVTGRNWRTASGLRIGSTLSRLGHLYPNAVDEDSTKHQIWFTSPTAAWRLRPIKSEAAHFEIVAFVRRGVVVGIGIESFGH